MDGLRSMAVPTPLTKLYTDAKRSYQALSQQASTDDTPEMASLHRKSRMQKDRLIAWGLEWQDQNSVNGDSIDESVTRAGLGEAVGSIMDNIKQHIDDMDALCNRKKTVSSPTGFPLEKESSSSKWSPADMQKYDELATNLTSSIDLLCDISQSKRMADASQHPEKTNQSSKGGKAFESKQFPEYPVQAPFTSFNSFKLNRADLILPQETPPPYDDAGLEVSARVVGRLKTNYTVPPLEHRFRMALELCQGMKFLLDKGFSHRSLNSNSIFFFPHGAGGHSPMTTSTPATHFDLRRPAISSFDFFSEYNIEKMPENIHQNMYRHPDDPRVRGVSSWATQYNSRFDLYSFGLVLLEIGLWMPLSDIFKEKYSLTDFRLRVGKIWVRKLPGKVTSPYMKAVNACLSSNDNNFLQALERAIHKLRLCCLIEEDSDSEDFQMTFDTPDIEVPNTSTLHGSDSTRLTQNSAAIDGTGLGSFDATFTDSPASSLIEPKKCDCILADKLKVFNEMAVSMEVRQQCDLLRRKLEPFVERVLRKQHEGCSIALEMLGDSEERARPYIHIVCKSTALVYTYVNKFFKGDETYCDIAVSQGRIIRSKAQRNTDTDLTRRSAGLAGCKAAKNREYQMLPSCGASIGAYRNHSHLPPVSYGGLVMVDGQAYGMTVHHLLEDPDEDSDDGEEEAEIDGDQRSRIERPLPPQEVAEEELDPDLLADLATIKAGQIDKMDEDSANTDGDVPGVERGSGTSIQITQPALDDLDEDFFPDPEDRDEEHLLSHKLGQVYSSSGLRRLRKDGIEHEIDWLLLKLEEGRLQTSNIVPGGRLFCRSPAIDGPAKLREPVWRKQFKSNQDLYPRQIAASADLAGLSVHSFGRTSGLGCGKISSGMSSIKFPGRQHFTQTWTVHGNFGHPGDSGAWVVDNKDGRICGHVLGWSSRQDCAIIAPMEVTFEDIKSTLRASRICLPGANEPQATRRAMTNASLLRGGELSRSPSSSSSGSEEAKRVRMMANHYLMSGSPGHMEREWSSRRSTLGSEQLQASS
ncbi:hypothetical protein FH972_026218 [Carpinus fangiana]|uniref:Protein kinase domain-containing protein n=1 Tax=Carpinus fangiana TaxID=176857 RepID=A0A5N6L3P9_9ROSI|nr:hypothetical protein FH972_026218 [Carpinus fangiana]